MRRSGNGAPRMLQEVVYIDTARARISGNPFRHVCTAAAAAAVHVVIYHFIHYLFRTRGCLSLTRAVFMPILLLLASSPARVCIYVRAITGRYGGAYNMACIYVYTHRRTLMTRGKRARERGKGRNGKADAVDEDIVGARARYLHGERVICIMCVRVWAAVFGMSMRRWWGVCVGKGLDLNLKMDCNAGYVKAMICKGIYWRLYSCVLIYCAGRCIPNVLRVWINLNWLS